MEVIHEFNSKTAKLIQNGYQIKTGVYISRGWDILRRRTDFFILFTIIFFLGASIPVGSILLMHPLAAGFLLVASYLTSGKEVIFENFFDGFKHFAGLVLFTLIAGILIFLGFIALILPGIYLSVGYIFTPFYIVFARMNFWDAMESSRKLVHREWFSIFGFIIVLVLINFLGLLAFGLGLLITVPLSYCTLYAAFDDIVGISN